VLGSSLNAMPIGLAMGIAILLRQIRRELGCIIDGKTLRNIGSGIVLAGQRKSVGRKGSFTERVIKEWKGTECGEWAEIATHLWHCGIAIPMNPSRS